MGVIDQDKVANDFRDRMKEVYGINLSLYQAVWYVAQKQLLEQSRSRIEIEHLCVSPPAV